MRSLILIVVVLGASGCFRYVPAQIETTPPGEGVRLLVTRQGAAELSSVAEVDPVAPTIDGTVLGVEGSELLLRVAVGERREGFISTDLSQTIRVPTGEIVSFQRREFDKAGTVLLVGGGAAFVTAVAVFILDPRRGAGEDTDPDPDDLGLSFSLFSIPIGR